MESATAGIREMIDFRLTGARNEQRRKAASGSSFRPVLLAPFEDLSKLRYDYPLVLLEGDDVHVRRLSGIMDEILREIAPQGIRGERLRKHVLGLETEMRMLVAHGARGTLSDTWKRAQRNLLARSDKADAGVLESSLNSARDAIKVDGRLLDCNEALPATLLRHVWTRVQARRTRAALDRIHDLGLKLSDMLKVDYLKSEDARAPARLKESVGTSYQGAFDFDKLSRVVKTSNDSGLPEKRLHRIRAALEVLESQRFFRVAAEGELHGFVFDSLAEATDAIRERSSEMVELIKAISIAELEIDNHYRECWHDAFFERFDATALSSEDVMFFPWYLVCLRNISSREQADVIEALASGLPIKILVQNSDILGTPSTNVGRLDLGTGGQRLARMAVALGGAWVLQSAGSNLYRCRDAILSGLECEGPALFSVFSGSTGTMPQVAPYLSAAAAMQSRAFPAFAYDPGAGSDLASRYCMLANPHDETTWPQQIFAYEDKALQRRSESTAFTFIDFVALDARYAGHFAVVTHERWNENMLPAGDYLTLPDEDAADKVPYVSLIDEHDRLHRFIVDDKLIHGARRCADLWHALQEWCGINNSWAQALSAKEKEAREQDQAREPGVLDREPPAPVVGPEAAQADTLPADVVPGPASAEAAPVDEAFIETPRCTTCDECTDHNNRMFAYDDNMQAYIADPSAGTYREMVEAAEACQVSIIHPGKPRNPGEPGLDDLIKRAEPFN